MALAPFPGFIGGSYTSWSPYTDAQDTMNLFVEHIESKPATVAGGSAVPASLALYGTPGLTLFETLPTSPVRGLWANATRLFAVAGSKLYEVFSSIVNTAGTAVAWVSGSTFVAGMAGTTIRIAGVNYTVSAFVSSISITLTGSAGTQSGVAAIGYNQRGDVGTDGLPAQIFPNGSQLLIVSAGIAYYDNGAGPVAATFSGGGVGVVNTAAAVFPAGSLVTWVSGSTFAGLAAFQQIVINAVTYVIGNVIDSTHLTLLINNAGVQSGVAWSTPTTSITASSGGFLDGYFIVAQPSTKQINISGINNGAAWAPLDFAIKEAYPDNIVTLLVDHEEAWLFGTDTIEVWQNTGGTPGATFPLVRIPGAFIPHGCCAAASPVRLGESVGWLSSDAARGGVVAYLAAGFQPTRVSTSAIEQIWRGYSTVADAVSYTYVDQGHEFWVITFPSGNATWCYDRTAGYWAKRGWWNGASNDRQRGMFHAWIFGKHIVGDWSTGALYVMDMATTTDAGTQITRVRAARMPSTKSGDWSYLHKFRLIADNTGALNPSLDYSLDGGKNFIGARTTAPPLVAGAFGYYDWRALGRHRDRVLRITITAAVKVALIEAAVDVE